MAEAAGLILSAVALAGLATDCIEYFDIIELTKTYSRDFEILETSLEAQKVRLIIWLQANGLVGPITYNQILDDSLVRGSIDRALKCVKLLFEDCEALRQKYGLQTISARENTTSGPRIPIFNETYRQFRARLKNIQRSTTATRKTKWAIYDKNKFKSFVEDLKSMIDVVENITQSAEQLRRRQQLVAAEVDSIMDEGHLQLVQEVASLSSDSDLSSAASRRLRLLGNTIASERASFAATANNTITSDETFYSARSHITQVGNDILSTDTDSGDQQHLKQLQIAKQRYYDPSRIRSVGRIKDLENRLQASLAEVESGATTKKGTTSNIELTNSGRMVMRMLREISMSKDDLPLVGFAPVQGGDLSYLLGHFLGPRDTPYEGGISYVRIFIPGNYPLVAPICQLLTRVYHPNIDANGRICLDLLYKHWTPVNNVRFILICLSTLLDTPNTTDSLVPEIAATYTNNRAEYDRIAQLYTTTYAMGDKPVLPLASDAGQARPWWQDVRIST